MATQTVAQQASRHSRWMTWFAALFFVTAVAVLVAYAIYRTVEIAPPRTYEVYIPEQAYIVETAPTPIQGSGTVPLTFGSLKERKPTPVFVQLQKYGGKIYYYGYLPEEPSNFFTTNQIIEPSSTHMGAVRRTFRMEGNRVEVTDRKSIFSLPASIMMGVLLSIWIFSLFIYKERKERPSS